MSGDDKVLEIVLQAKAEARRIVMAVMALEKFDERLHVALVARDISQAPDQAALGALYTGHVRCCWDDELDNAARNRQRELQSVNAETPF